MTDDPNDPLTSLRRDADPPALLKPRVMQSLRGRGVLRPPAPRWRTPGLVAAGLLLFAAGLFTGRARGPAPADTRPAWALLLYEGPGFDRTTPEHTYVAEYSAWAAGVARGGAAVSGEALGTGSTLLRDSAGVVRSESRGVEAAAGTMAGFFIIRAASAAEAEAIAKTCPHLRHGGTIALRPVIPT